jgi:hypothetical protein
MIRLTVRFDAAGLDCRQLRQAFAQALRTAIIDAKVSGRIELPIAEELWRVIPDPERA